MNISTYEARIKALEDQLNPPGPETGLVSVVVTPDITLSDGKSLNAKIAEFMPMQSGEISVAGTPHNTVQFEEGTEFTFTVTPGSDWYGAGIIPKQGMVTGEQGTPLVFTEKVFSDGGVTLNLAPKCGAAKSLPPGDDSPIISINISKNI